MKTIITYLTIVVLIKGTVLMSQSYVSDEPRVDRPFQSIEQDRSEGDSLRLWQEKVVLHTDSGHYVKGGSLFFKAYVLTGPNRMRFNVSDVLIVTLFDSSGEAVLTQNYQINDGTAHGSFDIPEFLDTGTYTFSAYTRWLLNYDESFYGSKTLQVTDGPSRQAIETEDAIKIEFYPEGGRLVSSLPNRLMVKISTEAGRPGRLNGKIVNKSGSMSAPLLHYASGLYATTFTPLPNESYTLVTKDGGAFDLPKALSKGFLMRVNNLNASKVILSIRSNNPSLKRQLYIKGEMAGETYFNKKLNLENSELQMDVSKDKLPHGILKITLYDEIENWASRFVHIGGENRLALAINRLKDDNNGYVFKIAVTDKIGNPVQTFLSLSAVGGNGNQEFLEQPLKDESFWSTSENPLKRENVFLYDLDALSMNGNTPDDEAVFTTGKIRFPFQKGFDLVGYAYDLHNNLLINKEIQLVASSHENAEIIESTTDTDGILRLTNLQLHGENIVVFRTKGGDSKSRLVKFVPIENTIESAPQIKQAWSERRRIRTADEFGHGREGDTDRLIELDPVDIKDRKISKRASPPVYGIQARQGRIAIQDPKRPKSIFELLLTIPGIVVSGSMMNPNIGFSQGEVYGNAPNQAGSVLDQPGPLWVVDGIAYENSNVFQSSWGLTANDIDRIEFVSRYNSDASMWGSRADRGVFLVYTRNGSEIDPTIRNEAQLKFQGYHVSQEFEMSQKAQAADRNKMGERRTLFWGPNIETDEHGEAIVRVKRQAEFDWIEITARTITQMGQIGSGVGRFSIAEK